MELANTVNSEVKRLRAKATDKIPAAGVYSELLKNCGTRVKKGLSLFFSQIYQVYQRGSKHYFLLPVIEIETLNRGSSDLPRLY